MTIMFPSTPVGSLPPAVLRTFRFFKSLSDDYAVFHHLAPWVAEAPDFLVLNAQKQALLIKVSGAMPKEVRAPQQIALLGEAVPLGVREKACLMNFCDTLTAHETALFAIPKLILFPSLTAQETRTLQLDSHDLVCMGKDFFNETTLPKLFTCPALTPLEHQILRERFSPEVVVPITLTTRQPSKRQTEAGLKNFLLDYHQERVLKEDLELPEEGKALVQDFGLQIVNGVAGSGKTLLILYRLRLLTNLYPHKRFLVLTHNRPLIRDMQTRYEKLTNENSAFIEWLTFAGWCTKHWPLTPAWRTPIGNERRKRLLESIWREHLAETDLSLGMFQSELDWFKDQGHLEKAAYLSVDRRGRGFRLLQTQREKMFAAMYAYQTTLREKGQMDWGDVYRRMWKFMEEGKVVPPVYDAIFVDEAQFFAPVWFAIIRKLLKPKVGHLFLVADPTQGFLRQGTSWKSLGLEVRGHTHQLNRSYRTTREILHFATHFYQQHMPSSEDEEEVVPADLSHLPVGVVPQIIPLLSPQDETLRVVNEIVFFHEHGIPLHQMLVLHTDWQGRDQLLQFIQKRLSPGAAADPKDRAPGDFVRVTTLNAGAGLESPIVFLVGLHHLFEQEQSLRLSDEEKERLRAENSRKIYMAATRAGQRLVLTYVGKLPDDLKNFIYSNGEEDSTAPLKSPQ